MTDETDTTTPDQQTEQPQPITEAAHERGSDGELLSVTETLEIHDQEFEAEIIPATTGDRNEWKQRLEDEGEELSDGITADLLDEFAAHEPSDFGADSWDGVRPMVTDALGSAVLARLFDAEDVDQFAETLQEVTAEAQGNQT